MTGDGPPNGFSLELPETWEVVETPPGESIRVSLGDHPIGPATASVRLSQLENATDASLRARFVGVIDGAPCDADLAVGLYDTGTANDPRMMLAELSRAADADRLEIVALPAGTSLRRHGRVGASLHHQVYVPVPGTATEVAFLSFTSTAADREIDLRDAFDDVVARFSFAWPEDLPATAPFVAPEGWDIVSPEDSDRGFRLGRVTRDGSPAGEEGEGGFVTGEEDGRARRDRFRRSRGSGWDPHPRDILRSLFGGWPGRFSSMAHLAVALWMAVVLIYAGQVVAGLIDGDGLLISRISRGVMFGGFGLFGYVFDASTRRMGNLVSWAVFGAVLSGLAATCPEFSRFGGC